MGGAGSGRVYQEANDDRLIAVAREGTNLLKLIVLVDLKVLLLQIAPRSGPCYSVTVTGTMTSLTFERKVVSGAFCAWQKGRQNRNVGTMGRNRLLQPAVPQITAVRHFSAFGVSNRHPNETIEWHSPRHGHHWRCAQRNLDFYVGVLGLRLVKKTVNFDDRIVITFITATRQARRAHCSPSLPGRAPRLDGLAQRAVQFILRFLKEHSTGGRSGCGFGATWLAGGVRSYGMRLELVEGDSQPPRPPSYAFRRLHCTWRM